MVRKYDIITELYNRTAKSVTSSPQNWKAFLSSACYNFRLRFDEQLLVYAQRPDARAVLEIERWNENFGRWVNKGARGIAVFEDADRIRQRIAYYFDISDTHPSKFSRPVPIWEMKPEYTEDVIETLESTFGELEDKSSIEKAILSAAKNAAEDNLADYIEDFQHCGANSDIQHLSAEEAYRLYVSLATDSIAFMIMSRLGLDTESSFEKDAFDGIANFNSVETLNAIGFATSDIAEMGLAEISKTIISLEKENRIIAKKQKTDYNADENKRNERSNQNERTDLHDAGRLPNSRTDNAGTERSDLGTIRTDEKEISETGSQSSLLQSPHHLQDERASDGSRAESDGDGRTTHQGNGGEGRFDRADESDGYDGLGSQDEQHQELGAGDSNSQSDSRLTDDDTKPLPSISEQLNYIETKAEGKTSAFAISQEDIDSVLQYGSIMQDGKIRIYLHYQEMHTLEESVAFLKKEYGQGGCTFYYPDGTKGGMSFDGKGIHIEKHGNFAEPDMIIPWKKVSARLNELINADRYLNQKEKDYLPQYLERKELQRIELELASERNERLRHLMSFIDIPIEDKKDTLMERLTAYLNDIIGYEKDLAESFGLTELLNQDQDSVAAYMSNPKNKANLIAYIDKVAGSTTDAYIRNLAYSFSKELKATLQWEYAYHLGDTIYIGASEYELLSFDDDRVLLYDTEFPMFNKEMSRAEFDTKVQENPMNDHLKVMVEVEAPKNEVQYKQPYKNYLDVKAENPDSIVLYQVGDFYEAFNDDAKIMADALDLTITSRSVTENERVPMVGVPHHRLSVYTDMLLSRGYDVTLAPLTDGERKTYLLRSNNKEDPVETKPIGRIDYLHTDGRVKESIEYTSIYKFEKDIKEEHSFGVPLQVVIYTDEYGKTVPYDFIYKLDPPLHGTSVVVSPYVEKLLTLEEELAKIENVNKPITPAWEQEKKGKVKPFILHPEIPMSDRHNFDLKNHEIEEVGKKERFRRNMDAINVLKNCELEDRFATPEEQEILSKYVGWGGIPEAFDENNASWANEFTELYTALSPEEYSSARESTLTAFYTPPAVIQAVYKAMEQMGFREGNILEPSCGIGHFIGMMPDSMKDSKIYGVELDTISAGIAQQLYQKTSIAAQPFEEANLPDSFFDAVVGNVPFGDFKVSDKKYDKHKFLIHDYFFAKSLDKLRPGGVMALITSKGTMDKENPAVRKYIAQRADLLGAIRLPNNTFKRNAGTEVVSDILILQKRDRLIDIEPDWVHLGKDENGITMNSYFVEHPEMILGEMKMVSGRFGPEPTCEPIESADLGEQLAEAIVNIHGEIADYEIDEELAEEDNSIPADPNVRNFSYTVFEDKIYFRENSRMIPVDMSATAENRIKGMISIRDSVRNLIELQTEDYPDSDIKAEQENLNKLYDDFTKKYGLINSRANISAFSQDSSFSLLSALEILADDGTLERKADMFHKRTIKPHTPVTSVDTSSEALAVSMGEKACVDMEYMMQLSGKTEEEIYNDLKGVIFLNPLYEYGGVAQSKYLMADEYLSGNVREKLATAKKSALIYPEDYKVNVEALEKVQPKDLTASEISVRLGSTWLPTDVIEQFIHEFLDPAYYRRFKIKVHFSEYTGDWNIEGKSEDRGNIKAYSTYGTARINAYKIIEETLNLKDVRIFDYVEDDEGKKKPVLNKKETAIAQAKQELIKQGFQDWIWADPKRRERLSKIYNEKFNSIRPREYDGSHITFNGMNPEIELREHQRNAVAHILYGGNTLLAHAVGAGKTFEMTAAAMESKRLGLCSKSMFVVPNHLTEQWAGEFLQLYPSANILVATKKDFEKKNRKRFCGRIATGDYDAIIIGHSQFEKIPMSIERQCAILEQQLEEVTNGIAELKRQRGDKFSVKQLERTKKSLKIKLDKLNDQSRKDDVVTFEELGVDRLFIDESHYYKNLFLYTKMRNVGGIAQTEAQKSSDLFMKCRYLDEITGGRGTVFATGTPISNSMVELYTIQRYLQYNTLVKNGLQHFDSWASTFGETVTAIELSPEGTGYRAKTRFAKFHNLPELMSMFKEVADIQTADMLHLPIPKANFHNVAVKPSEMQKAMVADLAERAEKVRNKMVDSSVDNMLKITNDGRKLALDQRMINPNLPDFEGSKLNACVDNIYRIWEEGKEKYAAQLFFCDLSTPKSDGTFSVYNDIRKKLIERGIPESEIRFIHDADTEAKKLELFKKTRKGEVRLLMGSTQKMGAGTNVQNKLIALHDLDCPWRPSDLEQRLGRIVRQGNENLEVDIYRYVTEETFDAYLYQLVEGKQKFASQIMTSKSPVRSAEDIDETALSYAEIKMLATGNPYIKEKMDLDIQVQKLRLLKSNFLSEKYALEDKIIKFYPQEIARRTNTINGLKADIERTAQHPKSIDDTFVGMTVSGVFYSEKADAGKAIIEVCQSLTNPDPIPLGDYRGFSMDIFFDTMAREYVVRLKGEMSYSVSLGADIHGNITRIDNVLEGLPKRLANAELELDNVRKQFETAQADVEKPFVHEDELNTKTARLNELNALLNVDKRENEIVDGEPDESDEVPEPKKKEQAR